jgi:hypothetical protein
MNRRYALLAALAMLACDPVHASEVAALGGETPGVPHGPLHRPGEACTLCHNGAFRQPSAFSVAGTVFETPSSMQGADGVTVTMVDATGASYSATTNVAGNFYVTPSEWTPAFPITSAIVQSRQVTATMYSEIGRNSSCGWCHTSPAGQSSPGYVSLQLDDGGTPP